MSTAQLIVEVPPWHPGQVQIDEALQDHRFVWVTCGRRFGKTTYATDKCQDIAAEGGRSWIVTPSHRHPSAIVAWRELANFAAQIPGTTVRIVPKCVEYPGGGEVWLRSADDPDTLRGEGLDLVIVDECPLIQKRAWEECIQPALMDREGKALLLGTPKGMNWYAHEHRAAKRDTSGESTALQMPFTVNPHIPQSEKDRIVRAYKEGRIAERVYRQEYLAEFISDAGAVFRRVTEAATATAQDAPIAGHEYVFGVDWGKLHDATAIAVVDATASELVYLDRMTRIDYQMQLGRLQALAERFQPRDIVAERNAMGEPLIEQLQRAGLPVTPFTTTWESKNQAVEALALAFENGSIKIIPDAVLIDELQGFEAEEASSGRTKYKAGSGIHGGHGDCAMALCFAWSGTLTGDLGCVLLG